MLCKLKFKFVRHFNSQGLLSQRYGRKEISIPGSSGCLRLWRGVFDTFRWKGIFNLRCFQQGVINLPRSNWYAVHDEANLSFQRRHTRSGVPHISLHELCLCSPHSSFQQNGSTVGNHSIKIANLVF